MVVDIRVSTAPLPLPRPATVHLVQAIADLVSRTRLSVSTEKALQADFEQMLCSASVPFDREFRLSHTDIPDFFVDNRIVFECKLRGARKVQIYRQIERYSLYSRVDALVLVSNVSMGLPGIINGKPVYQLSISAAWL